MDRKSMKVIRALIKPNSYSNQKKNNNLLGIAKRLDADRMLEQGRKVRGENLLQYKYLKSDIESVGLLGSSWKKIDVLSCQRRNEC